MLNRPEESFWRLEHACLAAVLARHDLSWESARVYLALADLTLGFGQERDIVSLGQLAAHAGMDRPHVARGLKRLAVLGLYEQAQAGGQKVCRWVTWPPPSVAAAGNTLSPPSAAVAGNTTPTTTVAGAVARAGTHQDTKTLTTPPLTPPQAGECVRVSDLLDQNSIPTLELEILIAQVDKAYRAIHARGMPASWRRKIKREYRLGDRESLAEIDEKAIRSGIKLANKKERTFGFGWVLRYLSDQAAARIARAEANRNCQTSQTTQEESGVQAEVEKAAQAAQADQRRAYFDGLPDELQKAYMEKAMAGPFMPRRLDVIRYVAAQMAWQDRQGSGTAIHHG